MKVTEEDLRATGLWYRELFYLEPSEEQPLPFFSYTEIRTRNLPQGWTRVSPRWYPELVVKGWQDRLRMKIVQSAWTAPVIEDSLAKKKWMDQCLAGCSPWRLGDWVRPRTRKLMRMSRRELWKWVVLRKKPLRPGRLSSSADSRRGLFGRVAFSRGKGVLKPGAVNEREESLLSPSWADQEGMEVAGWVLPEDVDPVPGYLDNVYRMVRPPPALLNFPPEYAEC